MCRQVGGCSVDGTQRWPAVRGLDAAVLFLLALERAGAGTSWDAVADGGTRFARSPPSSADGWACRSSPVPAENVGPLGQIFANNQPASSA